MLVMDQWLRSAVDKSWVSSYHEGKQSLGNGGQLTYATLKSSFQNMADWNQLCYSKLSS